MQVSVDGQVFELVSFGEWANKSLTSAQIDKVNKWIAKNIPSNLNEDSADEIL